MRSRFFLHAAAGAAVILTLTFFGCASDGSSNEDSGTPPGAADPQELFEPGPYDVGFREFPITYDAAGDGGEREILLRVWYPADPGSDAPPARYQVGGIVDLPAQLALDSPPITEDGDLPFVVHSHGNGGEGLTSYPYGELMASHGWIHVAPNHTGNTALDFLGTPDPTTRSSLDRPTDITAIIDAFESGLDGDPLAGKAVTSEVFVYGHSFGGYTTFAKAGASIDVDRQLEACEGSDSAGCEVTNTPENEEAFREGFLDPRVVALAPQAPAIGSFEEEALSGLGIPVMLMTGRLDQTTTQETSAIPSWNQLDGESDIWVEMPEGGHFSFITICYDLEKAIRDIFQPDADEDGCGPEFVDAEEAIPVLTAYVLAFGRRHVLDETQWDDVLEGPPLGNDGDFVISLK
jgi:predicted dienelactone hydrolase